VKDLSEKDKIAVGAVKVSIQARLLQMAAATVFGEAEFTRFDPLTIGMNSPDASAALRSGAGEVDTNFSLPPFQYAELKIPGIHTLASSNDIMGGPHTFTMVYATGKFHDANPKTYQAFLAAIKEAIATINRDKSGVARTYIEMTHSKESVADIVAILDDPLVHFTMTPAGTIKFSGRGCGSGVKCSLEFRRKVDESKTKNPIENRQRRDPALAPCRGGHAGVARRAGAGMEQGRVRNPQSR